MCFCLLFTYLNVSVAEGHTIKDVSSVQGLLFLLQDIHVECSSVPHLIIAVHHAPTHTKQTQLLYIHSYKYCQLCTLYMHRQKKKTCGSGSIKIKVIIAGVYIVLMHHTAGITFASGPARSAAGRRSVLQT